MPPSCDTHVNAPYPTDNTRKFQTQTPPLPPSPGARRKCFCEEMVQAHGEHVRHGTPNTSKGPCKLSWTPYRTAPHRAHTYARSARFAAAFACNRSDERSENTPARSSWSPKRTAHLDTSGDSFLSLSPDHRTEVKNPAETWKFQTQVPLPPSSQNT